MKALGRHLLVELKDCTANLDDVRGVQRAMHEAAVAAGATVVNEVFQVFEPHGVSGVVVIAESHLAIHTWPEYGFAAVDVFTCGDEVDPWLGFEHLRAAFGATSHSVVELRRGMLSPSDGRPLTHKPAA